VSSGIATPMRVSAVVGARVSQRRFSASETFSIVAL
jgi:hypothetical protein